METQTDAENLILDTQFTIEWLKEAICKTVGEYDRLKEWSAQPFAAGEGYMSNLIRVQLQWKGYVSSLPKSVILKLSSTHTVDESIEAVQGKDTRMDDFVVQCHRNECSIYDLFRKSCPIPIPRSFTAQHMDGQKPGVIVLEDLSDKARIFDALEVDSLTMEQVLAVVEALAKLHANCLTSGEWMQAKLEVQPIENMEIWGKFANKSISDLAKKYPRIFDAADVEKVTKASTVDFMWNHSIRTAENLLLPPVLCHGDLWSNNILFDKATGHTLAAIIDWQLVHAGACACDITMLLAHSCSAQFRKKHTDQVIKHYHSKLIEELPTAEAPYSLADVRRSYDYSLPIAAIKYIVPLPITLHKLEQAGTAGKKRTFIDASLRNAKRLIHDMIVS